MDIGGGTASAPGWEEASISYREGGTDETPAVVVRYDSPRESEDDLDVVFTSAITSDTGAIAYVVIDETLVFAASGFDEEMALELLAAFPDIGEDCVAQANVVDPEDVDPDE